MSGRTAPRHDWPDGIDFGVAHAARMEDYYLGGVAHFAVDREVAEAVAATHPGGIETARAAVHSIRAFLARSVRWLAAEPGVRQFLEVGAGIPNGDSVYTIARRAVPSPYVVYVDKDLTVLAHAHEVLGAAPRRSVAYLRGDLRELAPILDQAAATLDLTEPVAVLLSRVLHFLPDTDGDDDPYRVVARLMDAVAPGSYLVVGHLAGDIHPAELAEIRRRLDDATVETWVLRSRDEVLGFFGGMDLVEPGLVQVDQWRPDDGPGPVLPPEGRTNPLWVGVGRKQ